MDQAEHLRKIVKEHEIVPKQNARVITVTSGKGGVGKSSTSVNLAIQLSRLGKRVVVFDADFGLANVEVMLGIRPKFNLADLMFRGKELREIVTEGPENIGFVSGGSGIQELTKLTREQIIYLIQKLVQLDEMADVIIVDTGAGISDSVLEFVIASSEVLLVATPEPTSITDAYALLKSLRRKEEFVNSPPKIRMISNRISSANEGIEIYGKLNTVVNKFLDINFEYIGGIPQDKMMSQAIMQQKPVSLAYPNSPGAKAMEELAMKLCNLEADIAIEKRGIAKLFTNLIRGNILNHKKR
ncbi:MAG: MinD/ParA family protein [Clostridiales bacterium]|nr:MinD/ParA family protein [Clostridiales bacterium]